MKNGTWAINWLVIFLILLLPASLYGQGDCERAGSATVFHPNHIRTQMSPTGNLFSTLQDRGLYVPFTGDLTPSAIGYGSLWLAGYNSSDELCVSAPHVTSETRYEYVPGPIVVAGEPPDQGHCTQWDKVWVVTRKEIERHIADGSDGTIEIPIASIFAWPGVDNAFFLQYNGFSMPPNRESFAPFVDLNGNGSYEPQFGEYPSPEGIHADQIPEEMHWTVFNDLTPLGHNRGHKLPLGVEVQMTSYGFFCADMPLLNRTIFVRFDIINRSGLQIKGLRTGIGIDPKLGCRDDLFGSLPQQDALFIYNADSIDGDGDNLCSGFFWHYNTYPGAPPTQSITFLDRPLHTIKFFLRSPTLDCCAYMKAPGNSIGFYRYLSGLWHDGTPLTRGGLGYNVPPNEITSFAFDGNVTDSTGWLAPAYLSTLYPFIVPATHLSTFDPDNSLRLTIALTTHYAEGNQYFENISLASEEISRVRMIFDSGFQGPCSPLDNCKLDCIWAGDANADGVVNEKDILWMGLYHGTEGPPRISPVKWEGFTGPNWDFNGLNGRNLKHADCNADGTIDKRELSTIRHFFGHTRDDSIHMITESQGAHFVLSLDPVESDNPVIRPSEKRLLHLDFKKNVIDSIYGLSYRLQLPFHYLDTYNHLQSISPFDIGENGVIEIREHPPYSIFTAVRTDRTNALLNDSRTGSIELQFLSNFLNLSGYDTVAIRIVNIEAILNDGSKIKLGSTKLDLIFTELPTSVEVPRNMEIEVFPNPSSGDIHISNSYSHEYKITIINTSGIDLVKEMDLQPQSQVQLKLSEGMYIIRFAGNSEHFTRKVLVF